MVNFILDYGEQIHDGVPVSASLSKYATRDIYALRNVFLAGQRTPFELAISRHVYDEIAATNQPRQRHYLETWFLDLWRYWCEIVERNDDLSNGTGEEIFRSKLTDSEPLCLLPDPEDRILVCDALVYRCEFFCTRDWRTILKYRDKLAILPLKIITPAEWWSIISRSHEQSDGWLK